MSPATLADAPLEAPAAMVPRAAARAAPRGG